VAVGEQVSEIHLETPHSERLLRAAAYRAIRDGRVAPGTPLWGYLTAGAVRARHGSVACLDTCRAALLDGSGATAATAEFPRSVFAAMAVARACHLVDRARGEEASREVIYSLHATRSDEEPFPIALPALEDLSIAALAAVSRREGAADAGEWIVTFTTPAFADGLAALAARSRASGVEAAAHVRSRLGFDPRSRRFVRILDRVVPAEGAEATARSVLTTAATWAKLLAGAAEEGPRAPSTAHTHLHLGSGGAPELAGAASAESAFPSEGPLPADHGPVISNEDLMTHYDSYPDSLSAALVVSVFPGESVVKRYGYTPDGVLAEENGSFALAAAGAAIRSTQEGGEGWR
jgi:hypothetical protein